MAINLSLSSPRAPNQPVAPIEYSQRHFNLFSDALRLYFNRVDGVFQSLLGFRGGKFLNNPYGAVSDTGDQLTTDNTATQVTFDTSDMVNGMTLASDSVSVEQPGIYNVQFSIQFANTDSQAHNTWVWLRKNTTDVVGTGSKYDVPSSHGSSDGYLIAVANFFVSLDANDVIKLYWATAKARTLAPADGVYIEAYAASASPFSMPAVPSAVMTVSFVSNLST